MIALLLPASPRARAAAADRSPPSRPTNLRVTAVAPYSVSLAWRPSSDNSGLYSYVIVASNGRTVTVPQTSTTAVFTNGIESRFAYLFYMYAIDAAGNKSPRSNTVSATTPADTTPPTAPVVTVTEVGPKHVSLAGLSTDNGPYIFYGVYKDGQPVSLGGSATSGTVSGLEPSTTCTFTVQAPDNGINYSAMSSPVTVTTTASNGSDTTPPTAPCNLSTYGMEFPDRETWLLWTQ